jgi:hypothetical protein
MIVRKEYTHLAVIDKENIYGFKYFYHNDKDLFKLCVDYTSTPIEEREEEKKYYLRKFNKKFYENEYLNYNKYYKHWGLGDDIEDAQYKTKFTWNEIEKIKKKFNTGLLEFARMVVEE